ncbi:hypothetical protein [Paraferrimonas haliotis]|uniref:Uncharacterized protein n=1 Tax=Paraferrimonas haliotis TaxID=2013866 RepID=A0AA37TN59_9GAMM|nr:hypothetical protein [Paraferrimonas haliotis]GLS84592.1 hypothetical protein GCM10007894_25690 [Paraferrimonas haliotis]
MIKSFIKTCLLGLLACTSMSFAQAQELQGFGSKFNGSTSHISFADWKAQGDVTIKIWLGELDKNEQGQYVWTHVLADSNSSQSVRLDANSIQVQFANQYIGIYQSFDFANTYYVELHVSDGRLTVTDGKGTASVADSSIQPSSMHFDVMYSRGEVYSAGILQALSLIDDANSTNTVNYRAQGFENLLPDTGTNFSLTDVEHIVPDEPPVDPCEENPDDCLPPVDPCEEDPDSCLPPENPCDDNDNWCLPGYDLDMSNAPVQSQADWDYEFNKQYPNTRPVMNITVGNDTGRFAWEAPIWLKAYVTMATTYQDTKYIDWAIELIDHMFNYTDEEREKRGEINVAGDKYWQAPRYYTNNPGTPVPGWRRHFPRDGIDWRVEALTDGRALVGVMYVVDYIKENGLSQYDDKANEYMQKAKRIIDSHDSSYSETRQPGIAGSYYYPNDTDKYGDDGLYSRPLPFNHNFAMAFPQLVMDKWSGESNYHTRVTNLWTFYADKMEYQSNGTCTWRYQYHVSDPNTKTEDLNHGDLDIEFAVKAFREGITGDEDLMQCITKSFTTVMYDGNGTYTDLIDGKGGSASSEHNTNTGWNWVELHQFDPRVANDVLTTLDRHANKTTWFGEYLAWANMLRLTK